MWTNEKEKVLRGAIRERFRSRTPPQTVDDVDPGGRVPRSEVRQMALDLCGERPPLEEDYLKQLSRWYRRMAQEETQKIRKDAATG